MKRKPCFLEILGRFLIVISVALFIISLIECYVGNDKGVFKIFIALFIFFIGYKIFYFGKSITDRRLGNDNHGEDLNDDENIYKDTLKKD